MDFILIKTFITFIHFAGVACGVGGATASDFLFFRAIKDKKISQDEYNLLETLSKVVGIGLGLFIVSGISFFILQYVELGTLTYITKEPFLAKLFIFSVLCIDAFIFAWYVLPKLRHAALEKKLTHIFSRHALSFSIVGAVSIVSWYYILALGAFRKINIFSFEHIVGVYALIVCCASVVAYLLIRLYIRNVK